MSTFIQFLLLIGLVQSIAATIIPVCGCNEVYVINSNKGEPTCDNLNPKICKLFTGCRCKPGFVRSKDKCIKQSDCPPQCGINEEYVCDCIKGELSCDNLKPFSCSPFKGCRCKLGYVRYNGKCIKECDCPPKCNANEEYVIKSNKGEPTCDNLNPISCSPFTGCRCKSGFVRHNGKCIKECDCPPKCTGVNEEYVKNVIIGEPTCDHPNPKSCTAFTGCRCKQGFVRFNGICIKKCDCPPKCTGVNEEYVTNCIKGEPTCDAPNSSSCRPFTGCRCKHGYVRHNGICIKECECPPKCTGVNEEYVINCIKGEPTCDVPNPSSCRPFTGCRCKHGYVRRNGICIKERECPPKCTGVNEEYVINCVEGEPTCDAPNPSSCSPFTGCRCKRGYVRHNGICIKECDCPPRCAANEEYVVESNEGEPTCDNLNPGSCVPFTGCRCKPGFVRYNGRCIKECDCPPICTGVNEEYVINCVEGEPTCDAPTPSSCSPFTGCRCKHGYVRHNGICIKECDCPPRCAANEEYVVDSNEGEPTCDNLNPGSCIPFTGCRCKPGFVRYNGRCIKECDCPPICTGVNEEYVINCVEGEPTCDAPTPSSCSPFTGCRCKHGYVRHNGICIKECDCPPRCDANEEYVVDSNEGEPTCDNLNPGSCVPFTGCRCKPGFVRYNGRCIKECDCPPICTGVNEEYVINCVEGEPTCDAPTPSSCSPFTGCRCKHGYVRHNGICIKECDCPPRCDANEEYVVDSNEGEPTCDNLNPGSCVPFTGCRCKPGFVRYNGRCIKECDCPPICTGVNEEYVINCVEGEPTCDAPTPSSCSPFTGCRCKHGYVRHNGICIKECDCPPRCDANEEYVVDSNEGEPTCDNLNPGSCVPFTGCRCKPGFVRYNGRCIKECDCPPICTGVNEEYVINCVEGEPTCDAPTPSSCSPFTGCRCKHGYVRHNGICIKECDCPPRCDANEEYVVDSNEGEPTCDNLNPGSCVPFTGCRCKPGFVRYNGKCIKKCVCPPKCTGVNEEYVINCIKGEPTCDTPNPPSCRPFTGCRCKLGYVRHNGICIKECECPPKCTGVNEEYVINSIKGEPTCDTPNPSSCRPFTGCRCKLGYVRHNGKCIKECDCVPKCIGANEEYVKNCIKAEPTCDKPTPSSCSPFSGCRCKLGYVRYNGICIKQCDCPPKCGTNEEYVNGSSKGEPTCDNLRPLSCSPFSGCRCKSGFVRFKGKCIKECDCPPKCTGANEEYVVKCLKGEPTCRNPIPTSCVAFTGCRCKSGFVRYNGKCIKCCDCPPLGIPFPV